MIEELEEKIRSQLSLIANEVEDYFKTQFGIHMNEKMIYRAIKKAEENIKGSEKEQ